MVTEERSAEQGVHDFDGGLKKIANRVWGGFTAVYVHDLSASIPQKIKTVVDAEGCQTNN